VLLCALTKDRLTKNICTTFLVLCPYIVLNLNRQSELIRILVITNSTVHIISPHKVVLFSILLPRGAGAQGCSAAELFLDKSIKVGKVFKIVPLCIADLLTPRAKDPPPPTRPQNPPWKGKGGGVSQGGGEGSVGLMDDGQYVKRGGITLCTDSFSMGEVLLLKSVLEDKYGLQCTIHNKNPEKGPL
jgi:hypothetical protein